MREAVSQGSVKFRPDIVFYGAERRDSRDLEAVIAQQIHPDSSNMMSDKERQDYEENQAKFDLCPVTRKILMRWISNNGAAGTD